MKKTFGQIKIKKVDYYVAQQFASIDTLNESKQLNQIEFVEFMKTQKEFITKKADDYAIKLGLSMDDKQGRNKIVSRIIGKHAKAFREDYYSRRGWEL